MVPEVSIIMPIFNNESELPRSIGSILKQNFQNFELICVNDGSTDSTEKVLENLCNQDSRIFIKNVSNGGAARARNIGLSMAKGQYIYFMDSDDQIDKNLLSENIPLLKENEADCLIFSHYELVNDKKIFHPLGVNHISALNCSQFAQNFTTIFSDSIFNSFYSVNKIYKKEFLDKYAIRFPEKIFGEDMEFSYHVYEKINKIILNPSPYYYYIKRSKSVSGQFVMDQARLLDELSTARTMIYLLNDTWKLDTNLGYSHAIWAIYHYTRQNFIADEVIDKINPFLNWRIFHHLSSKSKIQFILIKAQFNKKLKCKSKK